MCAVCVVTEEWKHMSEKVNDSNKVRIEALARADEAMSKSSTAEVRRHTTQITSVHAM